MHVIVHRALGFATPTTDPKQRGFKRLVLSVGTQPVFVPAPFTELPEFKNALHHGHLQEWKQPAAPSAQQAAAEAPQGAPSAEGEATPEQSASEPAEKASESTDEDASEPEDTGSDAEDADGGDVTAEGDAKPAKGKKSKKG